MESTLIQGVPGPNWVYRSNLSQGLGFFSLAQVCLSRASARVPSPDYLLACSARYASNIKVFLTGGRQARKITCARLHLNLQPAICHLCTASNALFLVPDLPTLLSFVPHLSPPRLHMCCGSHPQLEQGIPPKKKSERENQISIDTSRHPRNTARLTHLNCESGKIDKQASKQRGHVLRDVGTTVFEVNKGDNQNSKQRISGELRKRLKKKKREGSSDDLVRRCVGTSDSRSTHLNREGILANCRRIFTVLLFFHARTASRPTDLDRPDLVDKRCCSSPIQVAVGLIRAWIKLGSLSSLILLVRSTLGKWVQHNLGILA